MGKDKQMMNCGVMSYDLEQEAVACVNELFCRDGSQPKSLRPRDAEYVKDIIECYLRNALNERLSKP